MITDKTVLILGAGASKPFRFPTGTELRNHVIEKSRSEGNTLFNQLSNYYRPYEIVEFGNELRLSGQASVDSFLEHRTEFKDIGVMSIALSLIPYEDKDRLFYNKYIENNWYEYLLRKLKSKVDDFDQNRLTIITFNYDRSIEYFLFTALSKTYGPKCSIEWSRIVDSMAIHVHGQLGYLPWQQGKPKRDYETSIDLDKIQEISQQIKIIPDTTMTPEYSLAINKINEAKDGRLFFLGFGYHDDNLNRLGKNNFSSKHPIGSSFGLGKADMDSILAKWSIRCPSSAEDVFKFVQNHVRL